MSRDFEVKPVDLDQIRGLREQSHGIDDWAPVGLSRRIYLTEAGKAKLEELKR